jgi:hypothetical protein
MTLSPAFVTAFANMAVRRLPHSHVFIHRPAFDGIVVLNLGLGVAGV